MAKRFFLTAHEVAARHTIPYPTVLSAVQGGRIPATRAGRLWLIRIEDADTFAAHHRPKGADRSLSST